MDKIIAEVKTQPKVVIENGVKKYVYTFEEFEKVVLEYMQSLGHIIDTDFVPDLIWAEDCFTDRYLFRMEYENNKRYVMEEEDYADE